MVTVSFTRIFCAAHRVWNDTGKCSNIHGHNYLVEIEIDLEDGDLNEQGFVTPFDAIKGVIDAYDHTLILDVNDPLTQRPGFNEVMEGLNIKYVVGAPSTERMAGIFATMIRNNVLSARIPEDFVVVRVAVRETAGIQAHAVSP